MSLSTTQLEPMMLASFAASLAALPPSEIAKAKSLYVRNAIADYQIATKSFRAMVIVMGVMSIIPLFLVVFVPALIMYRALKSGGKQKLLNALDVWRDDFPQDYELLRRRVEAM